MFQNFVEYKIKLSGIRLAFAFGNGSLLRNALICTIRSRSIRENVLFIREGIVGKRSFIDKSDLCWYVV